MQLLAYIAIGFAPGLFWLWYLRRKDDLEPEPKHLVLWVFFLGCASTFLVLWLRPMLEGIFPEGRGVQRDLRDAFLITTIPSKSPARRRQLRRRGKRTGREGKRKRGQRGG